MAVSRSRASKKPTARQRSRAAADAASHQPQLLIDTLDRTMARIEFDLDTTIRWANDNFLSVVGYSLAEVVGKPHAIFVDETTRESADYADF